MPKELTAKIKLHVPGGQATPAPPVGPALGQHGVNIGEFVKEFNDRTRNSGGITVPVVISVYNDRTFTFITKSPPASDLLKRAAGLAKGSPVPNREKVGEVTWDQVADIAKQKMQDLNAGSLAAACQIVAGTARSMGIDVEGTPPE
ncbi:MAG: 50S ribosomal protein L11 [Planctomycetota bacterium]